jgi:hypothetical protein
VDSGASNHMIGSHKLLTSLIENNSQFQVELGNNSKYAMKGVGITSFQLKSRNPLKMSEVLYVYRIKSTYSLSFLWRTEHMKWNSLMGRFFLG